jgi:hypothetical protein
MHEIGKDQLRHMVDLFVRETERRAALIQQFDDSDDREEIGIEAHSMKGGAKLLGLSEIASLARIIERSAGDLAAEELRDLGKQLDAALQRAKQDLQFDAALQNG